MARKLHGSTCLYPTEARIAGICFCTRLFHRCAQGQTQASCLRTDTPPVPLGTLTFREVTLGAVLLGAPCCPLRFPCWNLQVLTQGKGWVVSSPIMRLVSANIFPFKDWMCSGHGAPQLHCAPQLLGGDHLIDSSCKPRADAAFCPLHGRDTVKI